MRGGAFVCVCVGGEWGGLFRCEMLNFWSPGDVQVEISGKQLEHSLRMQLAIHRGKGEPTIKNLREIRLKAGTKKRRNQRERRRRPKVGQVIPSRILVSKGIRTKIISTSKEEYMPNATLRSRKSSLSWSLVFKNVRHTPDWAFTLLFRMFFPQTPMFLTPHLLQTFTCLLIGSFSSHPI